MPQKILKFENGKDNKGDRKGVTVREDRLIKIL